MCAAPFPANSRGFMRHGPCTCKGERERGWRYGRRRQNPSRLQRSTHCRLPRCVCHGPGRRSGACTGPRSSALCPLKPASWRRNRRRADPQGRGSGADTGLQRSTPAISPGHAPRLHGFGGNSRRAGRPGLPGATASMPADLGLISPVRRFATGNTGRIAKSGFPMCCSAHASAAPALPVLLQAPTAAGRASR